MRIDYVTQTVLGVSGVGQLEGRAHARELTREVAEHAYVLRALAGKEKRQIARRWATTIVDAVRRGPRRLFVGVEQAGDSSCQSGRIGMALLDDEQ